MEQTQQVRDHRTLTRNANPAHCPRDQSDMGVPSRSCTKSSACLPYSSACSPREAGGTAAAEAEAGAGAGAGGIKTEGDASAWAWAWLRKRMRLRRGGGGSAAATATAAAPAPLWGSRKASARRQRAGRRRPVGAMERGVRGGGGGSERRDEPLRLGNAVARRRWAVYKKIQGGKERNISMMTNILIHFGYLAIFIVNPETQPASYLNTVGT